MLGQRRLTVQGGRQESWSAPSTAVLEYNCVFAPFTWTKQWTPKHKNIHKRNLYKYKKTVCQFYAQGSISQFCLSSYFKHKAYYTLNSCCMQPAQLLLLCLRRRWHSLWSFCYSHQCLSYEKLYFFIYKSIWFYI